ncbi:tetraspanin-33-like [Mizuhopecten yessoensis]|uniref:tetraspanin-33-like n=1 Tax=Mizuhopecten yessoensis TaxID=6573 RepID=UPI000B458AC2|nr:tetraspanin-33-like [Mizuhopecten yessoensis]
MACCSQEDTFVSALVKYLLFFFNFGCWLFGGVLIGIGVWAFIEKNRFYHKEVQTVYDIIFDLSVIFFIIGFIIFILGYAGCIGALRENICLLKFYYITMIIIFLLLVVGAVLAFVFRDKVKQILVDVLQQNLITRYQDDPDGQSTIDWIQEKLYCCGVNGYRDWNSNQYFNCTEDNPSPLRCSVPYSCCRDPDVLTPGVPNILCGKDVLEESGDISIIYTIGCVDAGIRLAEKELPIMGGIVIGLAVPQLFGICLSRLLEGQVMDQRARWAQTHHGHHQ